jgi:hypothetical protein
VRLPDGSSFPRIAGERAHQAQTIRAMMPRTLPAFARPDSLGTGGWTARRGSNGFAGSARPSQLGSGVTPVSSAVSSHNRRATGSAVDDFGTFAWPTPPRISNGPAGP